MIQTCRITGKEFEITEDDLKFYEKIGVPAPTLCQEERQRRRLAWRNERKLYHRACNGTGRKIISMYLPENSSPVYENDYWWSDKWDAKNYGRDFDFSQTFFEQFQELFSVVPKMARVQQGENENSQYCNCSSWNKNSYLMVTTNECEDCLYGNLNLNNRDCVDCSVIARSELCYESINIGNGYHCLFSFALENCSNCIFCRDCVGCKNCFGCVNLHNKEYYFNNESLTKEEYEKKIKSLDLHKYSYLQNIKRGFYEFTKTFPHKYMEGIQNEGYCSGNIIYYSKNTQHSFDGEYLEDCKFCNDVTYLKTSYDISFYGCNGTNEFLYECEGVGHGVFNVKFSKLVWGGSSNMEYCYECFNSKDCFGCVGLRNAKYCILNQQYSKEEYFILHDKIIEHMKRTKEYGEFFPIELSPFAYNETVAQEYFPLEKPVGAQILVPFKYHWKNDEPGAKYNGPKVEIPDTIQETSDDICNQILECEECSKNYRIVKPELEFYRKMNLPVPHKCPDCRHKARMALRNPRKLWKRECDNCSKEIETTFSPERPEKVFCEDCYLEVVQ